MFVFKFFSFHPEKCQPHIASRPTKLPAECARCAATRPVRVLGDIVRRRRECYFVCDIRRSVGHICWGFLFLGVRVRSNGDFVCRASGESTTPNSFCLPKCTYVSLFGHGAERKKYCGIALSLAPPDADPSLPPCCQFPQSPSWIRRELQQDFNNPFIDAEAVLFLYLYSFSITLRYVSYVG